MSNPDNIQLSPPEGTSPVSNQAPRTAPPDVSEGSVPSAIGYTPTSGSRGAIQIPGLPAPDNYRQYYRYGQSIRRWWVAQPATTTTGLSGDSLANSLDNAGVSSASIAELSSTAAQTVSGTISSSAGTTVSYSYSGTYATTPTVVVSPTTNAGAFYLSSSTTTGFTVTYATSGAQSFNYKVTP